jgi:cytosine/adenosine deaminase-related metal-dependent hydrolase
VLIHAIGLSDKDIRDIARKKSNIVWCPNSNIFMFKRTGNVKKWMASRINVSLGTDSPQSGGMNLLDELHFAKKVLRKMYKKEIDDKSLVLMVTVNAARSFRIDKDLGSLEPGKIADLVAIKGKVEKPYTSLVKAELEDISLVVHKGKPVYGDKEYEDIFKAMNVDVSGFKLGKKQKLCIGNPLELLQTIRKMVGFHKQLPFLPIE